MLMRLAKQFRARIFKSVVLFLTNCPTLSRDSVYLLPKRKLKLFHHIAVLQKYF